MAFLESPAERARKFREQQAGVKPAAPIAQPGIPMARPGSLAPPNTAAPALGALPAVVNWATNQRDVKPVAPAPTTNPTNKPVMLTPPAVAAPGASSTQARMSPGAIGALPDYSKAPATAPVKSPSQSMTYDQASQAEVAARNPAPRPGSQVGAGAPSAAGRVAQRPDGVAVVKVSNGTNAYGATGASVAAAQGRIGSVNTQNFGNPVVPQAPGSIARPAVASTFGLGVNDPRMNDAIARPQVQLGPNQTNGFGTLRGPDQMAEQYNSREDREARQATNGNIDTALFMARGKPGSEAAIANLLETKARLNSGAEGLSQEAVQGRANRDNQFGIADLNNAGENNRAGIQADVARAGQQVVREGQQLDYGAKLADIARPQLKQDINGNYINIAGNTSTTVTDAQGNPVRGAQTEQAQQRDYGQENDNKMFTDLLATKIDQIGNPLPNAVDLAMADMQKYKAAQNPQQAAPAGMKQVGTSGGKPVYEDAKGNRFTL